MDVNKKIKIPDKWWLVENNSHTNFYMSSVIYKGKKRIICFDQSMIGGNMTFSLCNYDILELRNYFSYLDDKYETKLPVYLLKEIGKNYILKNFDEDVMWIPLEKFK